MNGAPAGFAQEFAELVPAGTVPLLIVRRRTCGCRIGSVYRVDGQFVMAGRRVSQVQQSATHWQSEPAWFLVPDLDSAERPEGYGCSHGSGVLLPAAMVANASLANGQNAHSMAAVAEAASAATRPRTAFIV